VNNDPGPICETRGVPYLPKSLQKGGNGVGTWEDIRVKQGKRR